MKTLILVVLALLGRLPLALRSLLGRVLGRLFSLIPTRDRLVAKLQMTCFLNLAPHQVARLLPKVYASVGQTLAEAINLEPFLKDPQRYGLNFDVSAGQEVLARGHGLVVLTAHTGNWDLLAAYMVQRGFELCAVGREARNPLLQDILQRFRNQYGIQTVWRSQASGIKEILQRLNSGQIVAALIDQDTRVKNEKSLFFGHPAMTPSALVRIAKDCGAPVASVFIVRVGFNSYEIHAEEIPAKLSIPETLDEYHRRLEALIRRYPWQWVWFHKRWRTRGDDSRLSGPEYIQYLKELCGQKAQPSPGE